MLTSTSVTNQSQAQGRSSRPATSTRPGRPRRSFRLPSTVHDSHLYPLYHLKEWRGHELGPHNSAKPHDPQERLSLTLFYQLSLGVG
jgi:hypothetical protein